MPNRNHSEPILIFYYRLIPPSKSPIMLALVFASKNNSFISPMSSRLICVRPASWQTIDAGVRSCNAYLGEYESVKGDSSSHRLDLPERSPCAFACDHFDHTRSERKTLHASANLNDSCDLLFRISLRFDDETAIQGRSETQCDATEGGTHRSKRSVGTPCGLTTSTVPRTVDVPRFVAKMTVGAIGDSRSRLR